jgi:hypothetical protein
MKLDRIRFGDRDGALGSDDISRVPSEREIIFDSKIDEYL